MKTYILRRLLLMIPTFFGISLIIFLVLNLAPGRPGAQQQPPADDHGVRVGISRQEGGELLDDRGDVALDEDTAVGPNLVGDQQVEIAIAECEGDALEQIVELDTGVGTCGKEGQSVPVGVGQPTLRIDELTVGGTADS